MANSQDPVATSWDILSEPCGQYEKGDKIGGRFIVHQTLCGAMGEVYLCYDKVEDYFYALKTFKRQFWANERVRQLFEEEVRAWIALGEHPHIVQCFKLQIIDNIPYMLLEWITDNDELVRLYEEHHAGSALLLDWYARLGRRGLSLRAEAHNPGHGSSLRDWLNKHKQLELPVALQFMIDLSQGLKHALQRRPDFVHRDLKPANILIDQHGKAKISDFGLTNIVGGADLDVARKVGSMTDTFVRTESGMGTPAYMAPEQWNTHNVDSRADIYAVGCIFFEMLVGHDPYSIARTDIAYEDVDRLKRAMRIAHQHLSLPQLPRIFPSQVDQLIRTCMQKSPADRFQDIDELIQALIRCSRSFSQRLGQPSQIEVPQTAEEINRVALTYAGLGEHERALAYFERAVKLDSSYPNTYTNRGATLHQLGRLDEALADYKQAIRLGRSSDNATVRNNRGLLYLQQGRYTKALAEFNSALSIDPIYANAYMNRALNKAYLSDTESAIHDFGRAIELNPKFAYAYLNRGCLLHSIGALNEAFLDYTIALEIEPSLARGYANRSLIYQEQGQLQAADADWKQALHLRPDLVFFYQVHRHLGWSPQNSQKLLKDTTEIGPPDSTTINNGWLDARIAQDNETSRTQDLDETLGFVPDNRTFLPRRVDVRVKNVVYSPRFHPSVQRRLDKGERISQLRLSVRLLDGRGIHIENREQRDIELLLDQEAQMQMEAEGLKTVYALEGRTLILLNDHPDDLEAPLRIYNIL